ncbi:N-acetylmuramoyl-L-alanine amidase [Clostridium beijerinckii]|uniref:N-acetylmuramoyl-L-alanine amidase n=1 Tax=Clostridium beijerinckii TaxID=1520 RepID=UPI00098CAAF2|nr:N-acetylmuramoyl-L-alanine amidase [Clostridium beijerinckii]MBA8934683.1 N-acetylmuramoyl-L-alanine amidase [Clostridium beijerinckii]NRU39083.1 N-acetylmuramoyl-L-alanine amidase [Clostridium beijerinckii]NSA97638.1 N-acetylmuramoyl-L-alanine amidase [Clostridium beijerinckii]OOM68371.1 sporulation-specific N-acetylmuramoyl-L-alanine amidase [Clostridium beijerinckii]OOM69241.1 sporulation-specific N-acetylmuramoyl-L-alanine amidase [Clostridium beijerinckii]
MKKFRCMVFGIFLVCTFILPFSYCNAEEATTTESSNSKVYDLQQDAFKYYQVEHKGALGIPVSYSSTESEAGDIRKYTVEPKYSESIDENKVEILISQVNVTGASDNFDSVLKDNKYIKNIKLDKLDNNTAKVDIETSGKLNVKINPVKRRYSSLGDNKYEFKTFIDVTFEEKVKDNSKIIIIDPGHGGSELGATANFTYEKQLNLDISKRVKENLEKAGYRIYITRDDDRNVGLLDRTDPANLLNADLFFCIHNNSLPLDVNMQSVYMFRGTTVLYNSTAPKPGREFATILMREVSSTIKTNTYPLQDRPNLAVLSSAWCPAVLMETTVECDDGDAKMMMHRLNSQKIADASLRAVNKYFIK